MNHCNDRSSNPGPRHPRKTRTQAGISERRPGLPGWERLRHGGLLLDATRLAELSRRVPGPLDERVGRQLRQRAGAMSDAEEDSGAISSFVAFVLEEVCGLDVSTGAWMRGSNVSPSWGRRAITGETVKPRHLWTGRNGARLPVFLDGGRRLGVGRGRRIVSQVLGWLRAGNDHLALVTNGRQWRLLFAGLDYDAWCEWDLDLWFEEGELSPQVAVLRTLLGPGLWTPEAEDAEAPLLQAIHDTRKGTGGTLRSARREGARGGGNPHPRPRRRAVRPGRGFGSGRWRIPRVSGGLCGSVVRRGSIRR